jgi:hypothetical protein
MDPQAPTPQKHDRVMSNPQIVTAIITGIVTVVAAFVGVVPQLAKNNVTLPLFTPTIASTLMVATATPFASPTEGQPTQPAFSATAVLPTTAQEVQPSPTYAPPTATPLPPTATQTVELSPTPLPMVPTNAPHLIPLQLTPNVFLRETSVAVPPDIATLPTVTEPATVVPSPPVQPPNVRVLYDEVSLTVVNQSGGLLSLVGVSFVSAAGRWDASQWGGRVHDRVPNGYCLRMRDASVGQRTPPAECVGIFGLMEVGSTVMFWRGVEQFTMEQNNNVIATCSAISRMCDVYLPQN